MLQRDARGTSKLNTTLPDLAPEERNAASLLFLGHPILPLVASAYNVPESLENVWKEGTDCAVAVSGVPSNIESIQDPMLGVGVNRYLSILTVHGVGIGVGVAVGLGVIVGDGVGVLVGLGVAV